MQLVSVSLPRLGGWRVIAVDGVVLVFDVSVSLPRLGGWRAFQPVPTPNGTATFQSRCRDWVVGEPEPGCCDQRLGSFSLVAEIGWLAREINVAQLQQEREFQSRCRDWVVGEPCNARLQDLLKSLFQSRCRDWVVGEPASPKMNDNGNGFSLVAEIGWLARGHCQTKTHYYSSFQSRCRDWVVGEQGIRGERGFSGAFQSRCRDWVVGEIRHQQPRAPRDVVSVSLPRLGGWRAKRVNERSCHEKCFSLVAEIGWLARIIMIFKAVG